MIYRVLAIAGSDSSGGAGIQADLKTFEAFGVYGMSAITAVTAQNTCGVEQILYVDPDLVARQMTMAMEDIGVDAIKIGMLGTPGIIAAVAKSLASVTVPIVVDPVMRTKGGGRLMEVEAEETFYEEILSRATVLTPNLPEAEDLLGFPVRDRVDMRRAARTLGHLGVPYPLIKGGHLNEEQAADLLWHQGREEWLETERIATVHTHGTGCTLSSAIAAGLARGQSVPEAVKAAKEYVTGAILRAPGFGHGHGPLWHGWRRAT